MATLRNMAKNSVHVITYSNSMEPIIPDGTAPRIDIEEQSKKLQWLNENVKLCSGSSITFWAIFSIETMSFLVSFLVEIVIGLISMIL